jgi:hypothetical protein
VSPHLSQKYLLIALIHRVLLRRVLAIAVLPAAHPISRCAARLPNPVPGSISRHALHRRAMLHLPPRPRPLQLTACRAPAATHCDSSPAHAEVLPFPTRRSCPLSTPWPLRCATSAMRCCDELHVASVSEVCCNCFIWILQK